MLSKGCGGIMAGQFVWGLVWQHIYTNSLGTSATQGPCKSLPSLFTKFYPLLSITC